MIDPLERWAQYGEKPDYAGLLTFGGVPCTHDPAELAGFDVAIVGAPMDDLVSDRPGARLAPRAIRGASSPPGPHLEAKVDAFAKELKDAGAKVTVVTYAKAKHSFTNPDASKFGMDGLAYDKEADTKSWNAAMKMFREAFKT